VTAATAEEEPTRRGGVLRGDRGSASIWLMAAGIMVVLFGLAAAQVGSAMIARHQAAAAADLGALAGARHAFSGEAAACARAAELVGANHARLTACALEGLDLVVTVEVDPGGPIRGLGTARAVARAGPVRQ